MSTLHLSKLLKKADGGFLGMDGHTLDSFKPALKHVGMGAGIGALGMGAADMFGNHQDEEEGDRVPNLLKSMALGGVLGAGGGGMYHALDTATKPELPPTPQGSILSQMYHAGKGLTNPGPSKAIGAGTTAYLMQKDYRRANNVGIGKTDALKDVDFNAHPKADSLQMDRELAAWKATQPPATSATAKQKLLDNEAKWIEAKGPNHANKTRLAIDALKPSTGQSAGNIIPRDVLGKAINIPGIEDIIDFKGQGLPPGKSQNFNPKLGPVDHPANAQANKLHGTLDPIDVKHLEPWQKAVAMVRNPYAKLRTWFDAFVRGVNPYEVNSIDPMHVDPNSMNYVARGGKNGLRAPDTTSPLRLKNRTTKAMEDVTPGAYSRHGYYPKNLTMEAFRTRKVPLSYGRGWMYRGPAVGLGTTLGLQGLNQWSTHHDNLQKMMQDPAYAQEQFYKQTPEYQEWLKQKFGNQ